ncbi:MAG: IPT/TIG domain-containing protein, partial [candidate division WOR-3 bacterium]
ITGSLPACQLSPSSGPIGTAVTIRGCRFGQYASSTSKVYFGDKEAEIVLCQGNPSWSETKIVAKVPELKEGSYQVKVVNSIGESNSKSFNVTSTPGPSIACVVPDYGKEGQEVQVFGERFGRSGVLTFNNVTSSPTFWSDNLIKVPVPPNAFSGDVVVTTNQPSNGYPFYVICESGIDCASLCCLQYECQSSEHCRCAQAEESCGNAPCCPGLSCCPDKKCRADCNVDGSCGPNGQCPSGYTCCPDNLCKINCGGNNPGQSCKMPDGTCGPDSRCTPYQCVSSVTSTSPITECRCCCRNNSGCPSGLKCETNEICYQSSTSTPAVYGLCCGCTQNNQCGIDNLCRTTEPRCCVGCQNQTNGTKCYVPGLPNNEGECCNGVCCHGYCLNGQCLTSCGNHQLEDNEQCDPTARPMFRPSQDTCQEVDPKYVGGTLGCNYNCTFDVSGCLESGQAGGIGELCIRQGVCSTGASSCQNPETYSCLVEGSDCRCCCDPKENKCPNNLTCTANKTPCTGSSRGLCCGCKDDSQCGEHSVCDSDDLCCHNLPSPTNLSFESNPNQIKISWIYPKDSFKYVTTFEIERAEKTDSACGTYLKIAEDKNCQPNTNIVNCSYIDRGNFGGKKFCYRIRARHGSQTAYSEWEKGEIEVQAGQVGCQANYPDDCSAKSPCCRKDTKQCVTWEFCEGHCDINGDCKPPSVRYAEADFQVTTGPIGACLISVVNNKSGSPNFGQSRGYWLDEIKATGKRFGDLQGKEDNLVFEENKNAPVNDWRDETILAQVPAGAKFDDNLVVVKKSGLPNSNAVSFKVLKQEVGPGQKCYDDNSCPLNIGVCSNPPNQNIFTCKASASNDCYCCCTPGTPDLCKNINQRLECKANQSPCTGSNRGLCCGCQNDDDCGEMGCGMIEPSPKCCYQRPSWLGLSFCENQGSPNVRLNTDITLKFDSLMDFGSLNSDQIKVSRVGDCEFNEGETKNGRCYLFGTISGYNSLEGNTTTTKAVFSPRNCRLKPNTEYKVEIAVGKNGQGVRSEKGVSMGDSDISCTWDLGKKCRSLSFTTVNSETLCTISWIDVQPRFQLVRELNKGVSYYGFARDESNQSVCVIGFDWSSSNSEVATVEPNSQNPRIGNATSTGAGEAIIIASASEKVCVQSPEKDRTCGKIRVDLGGPKVKEQQGCQVCANGGQS